MVINKYTFIHKPITLLSFFYRRTKTGMGHSKNKTPVLGNAISVLGVKLKRILVTL